MDGGAGEAVIGIRYSVIGIRYSVRLTPDASRLTPHASRQSSSRIILPVFISFLTLCKRIFTMASLIPGYEYDIFISYRQKDNKGDRWVSEFVEALKTELESTFKEEISVYFDINPHGGLLETHIVDASLKEKLKCLVFIPVISQTYCDPKSFAWQHEFCAFNKTAKEDPFGRDIRLSGGNVASRILPVKIHDLDPEDKELLENELGGILRSIEFIYKSSGVNRPLRANEDHPHDNINKTYYRDQINKVANAVKEIITALRKYDQNDSDIPRSIARTKPEPQKRLKPKIILLSVLFLILAVVGYFFILKLFKPDEITEKSIAVLPFKSLSDDPDKQYLADGVMDAVLLHLQKFKDLTVMSRTSVEQYRGTVKTTYVIGKELGVEYLLEGSFQKNGNNVRLIVQLIKTKKEGHAWANEYNRNWKDIFSVQSEVAQAIAKELYTAITPEEKKLVEKIPTKSLAAYELYLKANSYQGDYWFTRNLDSYQKAVTLYDAAIELDSTFASAYVGLAKNYFNRYYEEDFLKENFLDSCLVLANIALSYNDQLDEAFYIKGRYYQANGHNEEALDNYDKAILTNPNFTEAYYHRLGIISHTGDQVKLIENLDHLLKISKPDEHPFILGIIGSIYLSTGFIDKAKYYFQESFALDTTDKKGSLSRLFWIEFDNENFDGALKLSEKLRETDSTDWESIRISLFICSFIPGHNEEAYILTKKYIEQSKKNPSLTSLDFYDNAEQVGYAFWQAGKYKEARYYFEQKIKYFEAKIKRGRIGDTFIYYSLAAPYAFLGDSVKAYQYLDEYNKSFFFGLTALIDAKHNPLFANIRNEPRFQKILHNMEAKYQAEHERVRKWLEKQGKL